VTPANETALIELAYAASLMVLIEVSDRQWDKPLGDASPAQIERECYRLATQLELKPMVELASLEVLQSSWRRQLRQERQRNIFDMGFLLVRQHALLSFLQLHPDSPRRPELCFLLNQIRGSLTHLFNLYKLKDSLEKLPELPLPGASDAWMTWSGDTLRDSVLKELGGPPK
jgi:hypothetical protein